jgi:hypothetical protein
MSGGIGKLIVHCNDCAANDAVLPPKQAVRVVRTVFRKLFLAGSGAATVALRPITERCYMARRSPN